jgi:hypothetical protein
MIVHSEKYVTDAWNNLMSVLGGAQGGIVWTLAVVGAFILVWSIGSWLWQRRKGGVTAGGFPVMAVLLGAVLMGPALLFPILFGLIDIIITIVANIVKAVMARF